MKVTEGVAIAFRSYLSITHIQSAALLTRRSAELEGNNDPARAQLVHAAQRASVIGAIWSAVGCLEAAINEAFADAAEGNVTHLQGIPQATITLLGRTWKGVLSRKVNFTVLEKYECALDLAGCSQLDRGARPHQDVADLIKLRNALTHYVPETVAGPSLDPDDQHQFEKVFSNRFQTNPFTGQGNPFYPDKLLGHGCAEWATKSTIAFLDEFFRRLGLPAPFDHVRDSLGTQCAGQQADATDGPSGRR